MIVSTTASKTKWYISRCLSWHNNFASFTAISYIQEYMEPNCNFIISQVSCPARLPLEPQRAMISGLLLLSSSLRQALPARSLMTDNSLKMRAYWQTHTKLNLACWHTNVVCKGQTTQAQTVIFCKCFETALLILLQVIQSTPFCNPSETFFFSYAHSTA